MEAGAQIAGLDSALKAMQAAFPRDAKKQKQIINGAIRKSARSTILAAAKQRALTNTPGSSGALSESIGLRTQSKRKIMTSRSVGGMEITPIRSNLKAMAMYIQHYYTAKGRTPPAGILASGIRHGHLVEFGSVNNDARSFLWEPAQSSFRAYQQEFAKDFGIVVERNVRRAAKRGGGQGRGSRDFSFKRTGRVI